MGVVRLARDIHVSGGGGYCQGTPPYVIYHLMRDGAVVLEEVVIARLGGGGYLLYHGLLHDGTSVRGAQG